MNERKQECLVAVFVVVISLLLITVASAKESIFQTTGGQQEEQQNIFNTTNNTSNQSSIVNQSGTVVDSIQNQTLANQTGTAAQSLNLTQADFESLIEDLTEARQALENDDTVTLLDELNSASAELFQIITNPFDPLHVEALTQEFNLLQTHIDQAQETALRDERARTLEELDAAESELHKVTEMLPNGQE